jgi:hypothetical protein
MAKQEPFEELGEEAQRAAIDVSAAVAVLGARLPNAAQVINQVILVEFGEHFGNKGRAALRHVGSKLFTADWRLVVTKHDVRLETQFENLPSSNGSLKVK